MESTPSTPNTRGAESPLTPSAPPTRRRLDAAQEEILRKAYAQDGHVLRGVARNKILQLEAMRLVRIVGQGRYDRYALSSEGEVIAEELTRATEASSVPADDPVSDARRSAVLAELVDFLAGACGEATSLRIDLPGTSRTPSGLVVRVERCGPTKLLLQLIGSSSR